MQPHQSWTLDKYLSEKGPLDPVRAVKVAIQVALQMSAAGGAFLIHPGRILAVKDGSVRLLPLPAEDLSLPPMVEFPAYASPEEIRGGRADVRSGLYSLGCTIHELVTGETPYPGKDPKEVLRMHLELAPPEPLSASGPVPPGLAGTIRDLLAKDPELRIQTPDELVRRLRHALGEAPPPRQAAASHAAPGRTAPGHATGQGESRASPPPRGAPRTAPKAGTARPLHAASSKGGGGLRRRAHGQAHRPQAVDPNRDVDLDDEEAAPYEPPAPKRSFAFTITGALIGLLLGVVLVLQVLERKKVEPLAVEEEQRAELADVLKKRKEHFAKTEADVKGRIDQVLEQARKRKPEDRRELLTQNLEQYAGSRWGHLLASEVVKLGPAPKSKISQAEEIEVDKAYKELKAEAEKLRAAGRLGDAIGKMMEDYQKHKARHDAEITAFVEKLSTELTQKWEATKKEADRLLEAGEVDAAMASLKKAEDYGDSPIRTDVGQRLEGIQARAAAIEAEKKKPSDAEDADTPAEKADDEPDDEK